MRSILRSGKQVDCQSIRVAFVDEHGDLFGEQNSSWFGGDKFWRVGHEFQAFPRTRRELTFQITPWKTNQTVSVKFRNPHVAVPSPRSGKPLPQQQRVGDLEIFLASLTLRTNMGPKGVEYWRTPTRYWEPRWELRRGGKIATGWDAAEWIAEDASGNRAQFLGMYQPVLRFSANFFPNATNVTGTTLLASSPGVSIASLQSTQWWNLPVRFEKTEITVLGLFPAGVHIFSEGVYQTNPPVTMRGPGGGAPSGWVGQSKRLTPTLRKDWDGHYTPSPVIYLRAPPLAADNRLAVRLRDENGRYWPTKPEPQGAVRNIHPFLVETLAPEVKLIVAEVVVLKPVHAEFDVDTTRSAPH
jgi:hypothetical protein